MKALVTVIEIIVWHIVLNIYEKNISVVGAFFLGTIAIYLDFLIHLWIDKKRGNI